MNYKRVIFWDNEKELEEELKIAKLELKHRKITRIVTNKYFPKTTIYFKNK